MGCAGGRRGFPSATCILATNPPACLGVCRGAIQGVVGRVYSIWAIGLGVNLGVIAVCVGAVRYMVEGGCRRNRFSADCEGTVSGAPHTPEFS